MKTYKKIIELILIICIAVFSVYGFISCASPAAEEAMYNKTNSLSTFALAEPKTVTNSTSSYIAGMHEHELIHEIQEATCQSEGYDKYHCKSCDYVHETTIIPTTDHEYIESDLIQKGCYIFKKYSCKWCAVSYTKLVGDDHAHTIRTTSLNCFVDHLNPGIGASIHAPYCPKCGEYLQNGNTVYCIDNYTITYTEDNNCFIRYYIETNNKIEYVKVYTILFTINYPEHQQIEFNSGDTIDINFVINCLACSDYYNATVEIIR